MKLLVQARLDSEKIKDYKIIQYINNNPDIPTATLLRNALYEAAIKADNAAAKVQNPSVNYDNENIVKSTPKEKNLTLDPKERFNPHSI
ncbi:hypothetical protein EQ500_12165 [Lactobacillus sp. XV13L]|nr:hypothetical protein [Lactobacillus sp. XV13L]